MYDILRIGRYLEGVRVPVLFFDHYIAMKSVDISYDICIIYI